MVMLERTPCPLWGARKGDTPGAPAPPRAWPGGLCHRLSGLGEGKRQPQPPPAILWGTKTDKNRSHVRRPQSDRPQGFPEFIAEALLWKLLLPSTSRLAGKRESRGVRGQRRGLERGQHESQPPLRPQAAGGSTAVDDHTELRTALTDAPAGLCSSRDAMNPTLMGSP